ncbi:hypothetical protein J2S00_001324 [Caldalkalibacillus uzonensis]|uniref:Uncharacterized protein n=1 Tax=Caldalkalibacillus uzonensis TaxID=353224 RepID=A0ABU0CR39_9BACI|nr:hypothetical protein [Caldalkalibacillus uzonensis]
MKKRNISGESTIADMEENVWYITIRYITRIRPGG